MRIVQLFFILLQAYARKIKSHPTAAPATNFITPHTVHSIFLNKK